MSATKLAINYSPQAAALAAAGAVSVDLFKVPDWDDVIAEAAAHGPVFVHFSHQIGAARERPELERAAALMASTGTPRLNVHVAPSRERFGDIPVGDASPAALTAVVAELAADLQPLCEAFGAEAVVLESLIYRGDDRGLLRAGVEPAALSELVELTGCGLVLDVAHARITAATLGVDPWAYLDALPMRALRELHVSGVDVLDGAQRDHLPLKADDWAFLDGVMGRMAAGAWPAPSVLAFDYGGVGPVFAWRSDEDVIREQLPRLAALLASLR